MKLVFPQISAPIEFRENVLNSLVIENQPLFRSLIEDFHCQINGFDGFSVLSLNNSPVDIAKNVELITSFVPFELNRKSLIGKIISSLEKTAINETHYVRTSQLLSSIEKYIEDLTFEYPCDLECSKITVSALLKMVGLQIHEEMGNSLDKIIDYMELVREFEKDKLFIFVNMRSYYSDEQMEAFVQTVISHKYKILLLDASEHCRLRDEKRVIIDADLCEI